MLDKEVAESQRKKYITAAKELGYVNVVPDIVEKLKQAKTENEIIRLLRNAREEYIGKY